MRLQISLKIGSKFGSNGFLPQANLARSVVMCASAGFCVPLRGSVRLCVAPHPSFMAWGEWFLPQIFAPMVCFPPSQIGGSQGEYIAH